MSSASVETLRTVLSVTRNFFIRQQSLDGPISASRQSVYPDDSALNRAWLHLRHSLGQRTQFRVDIYALTRYGATTTYRRLRKQCVYINVGDPTQAELAIEAILTFAQSLDGKWLAPSESAQVTDPAVLRLPSADQQEIRSQSAGDSQDSSVALAESEAQRTQDDDVEGFSGS